MTRMGWLRSTAAGLLLFPLICLAPAALHGQANTTGSVVGQVLDPSGAAVSDAAVLLTDQGTGATQSLTTNADGRYVFLNVRLGTYSVSVTKAGFSQSKVANQAVSVGASTTVNIKLQVGAASTTVEVTSTPGAELQTMNATMGTTLNSAAMLTMPNIGRDASSLLTYQPATTSAGQVAGGILDQNTFTLDGGNNTDDLDGSNTAYNDPFATSGSGVVPTPVESLEELKVATNNQTADFGNSSGGEVMMVTKRGANAFHGSAYDFFQANFLDSDSWANDRLHTALVKQHQNRFGGALGGPLLPKFLGGKTYFYFNYEGRRYPNAATEEVSVPSTALRAGILTFQNAAGTDIPYNLKTATDCGTAGTSACDPRGIGIAPDVSQVWNNLIPAGNDPSSGDTLNTIGFRGPLSYPIKDDFTVSRFDHDFGQNWHAFVSYRWWREIAPSTAQLDIGGITPGDTLGTYAADANKPLQPDYWVAALNGQMTPAVSNQFNFNYVRNWWAWGTAGVPYVLADQGVQAGVSIEGNANGGSGLGLDPIDVGWGDARSRFWLGHDWNWKDDVSWLKGNHLYQVGATLNHYWLRNSENDANSALGTLRYILNSSSVQTSANYRPPTCTSTSTATSACIPASQATNWDTLYYATLGVVGQSNVVDTRTGANLQVGPPNTPEFDTVIINNGVLYFSDSWHIKPSFSLNYGLTYVHTSTPYEINGKQTLLVDPSGTLITAQQYFSTKEADALQGINYNPQLGFEPIEAMNGGSTSNQQTMIQPFWAGFEPRLSAAWNPTFNGGVGEKLFGHNQTVLRGGWSRLVDRLNNVGTAVSALLGDGFVQQNVCNGAEMPINGNPATCQGTGGVTAANAFRLGVDGNTVPMPVVTPTLQTPIYPGTCSFCNQPAQGVVQQLDYGWRPGISDEFTLSLQRQLPGSMILELGYVGRHGTHVAQTVNMNTVPYMFTEGGQTLAQAYLGISQAVIADGDTVSKTATFNPQPFFEAALGGPSSAYCTGFANCTTAVVQNESSNIIAQKVETMIQDIDNKNAWIFGPMLMSSGGLTGGITDGTPAAVDNYNAGTVSLNKRSSHGLTINTNFTWSRSLDDGESTQVYENGSYTANPFDESYDYGPSNFGYKYTFNLTGVYMLPFGNGERNLLGRVIGGWSFAPIFVWHSGSILSVSDSTQAFGQPGSTADAILTSQSALAGSGPQHIVAATSVGSAGNTGTQENFFSNPQAVYNSLSQPLLGLDTSAQTDLGYGRPAWNLNFTLAKDMRISEQIGATVTGEFVNALNHATWSNPSLSYTSPTTFGDISSATSGRTIELGLRLHF